MSLPRRGFLRASGALFAAAAARRALSAQGANKAAFESADVGGALEALGWGKPVASDKLQFIEPTPEVAEDGDAVPIALASSIPATTSIAILIERSAHVLAARFDFGESSEAFVSTRLKMSESGRVIAVARAGGVSYVAARLIGVTQCGCGA